MSACTVRRRAIRAPVSYPAERMRGLESCLRAGLSRTRNGGTMTSMTSMSSKPIVRAGLSVENPPEEEPKPDPVVTGGPVSGKAWVPAPEGDGRSAA